MNIETYSTLDRFEHKKRILTYYGLKLRNTGYLLYQRHADECIMLEPYSNTINYTKIIFKLKLYK